MSLIITFQSRVFTVPMETNQLEHMKPYLFYKEYYDKGGEFCLKCVEEYLDKCSDEIKSVNDLQCADFTELSDEYCLLLIYLYTLSKLDIQDRLNIKFIYNTLDNEGQVQMVQV